MATFGLLRKKSEAARRGDSAKLAAAQTAIAAPRPKLPLIVTCISAHLISSRAHCSLAAGLRIGLPDALIKPEAG